MCLIAFAHRVVPGYELVLIANRDEFLARPTAPLDWWPDHPQLLAGKDLVGGGTWMGVNRQGTWTAITNYREPLPPLNDPPSRGNLTKNILVNNLTLLSGDYSEQLNLEAYHGFNLLSGDRSGVGYLSNRNDQPTVSLEPGFYGLSNHLLNSPWPKVVKTKAAFRTAVGQGCIDFSQLFELLADTEKARIEELPNTGVPQEWEEILSSAYINAEHVGYGTRIRTILTISDLGKVQICEWRRGEAEPGEVFTFMRS